MEAATLWETNGHGLPMISQVVQAKGPGSFSDGILDGRWDCCLELGDSEFVLACDELGRVDFGVLNGTP